MNGAHDMGGMQGFGPVIREENEPVFHARWEARVMAIRRSLGAIGRLPPLLRPAIERIAPPVYLNIGYYEKWFIAMVDLLIARGVVTAVEIDSGKSAPGSVKADAALSPAEAASMPFRTPAVMLETAAPHRFSIGQAVRARNINPVGHTRLPRYARGRVGSIIRHQGVQAFPDLPQETPQHVYTVRFTARELWGPDASPSDSVYLDLWEDYLESA